MCVASWFSRALAAGLAAATLAAQPTASFAQARPSLFGDAPQTETALAQRPDVARARRLTVRADLLATALAPGASAQPAFVLNLFPDVALTLVRERLESDTRGYATWIGRVAGERDSVASLTWNGRALAGGVVSGGIGYDIQSSGDGAVLVTQRAQAALPVELPAALPRTTAADRVSAPLATALDGASAQIDVLVLYTAAARSRAGGATQIQAQLANAVAVTNTAFQRSGVNAVLTAVGVQELAYAEAADLGSDLNAISLGGAQSAAVEAARATTGADLVALVTGRASSSGGCGIAWLGPSSSAAYSVSEHACLYAGQWSFSHELGHNLGADHAPGDSALIGASYARGYRDASVRTLMAYAVYGSPARLLNFSSASVLEPAGTGLPTGNSLQDNARRLGETMAAVAAYRPRVGGGPGVPPAPTGLSANITPAGAAFAWSPVSGATSYILQIGRAPGDASVVTTTVTGTAVSGALAPGTYYWRVRAQNAAGPGPASTDGTVTVVTSGPSPSDAPGPPTAFVAAATGATVSMSWSPAVSGGAVSSYEIEAGPAPGSAAYGRIPLGQTSLAVPNVPNGTYYLRVRAVGPGGTSAPSADAMVTVGTACAAPGVSALTATVAGGAIALSWSAPSGTGPFTYHLVAGTSAGASNLGVYPMGGATAVSAAPAPGTYYVRVVATNACGVGAPSTDAVATVTATP